MISRPRPNRGRQRLTTRPAMSKRRPFSGGSIHPLNNPKTSFFIQQPVLSRLSTGRGRRCNAKAAPHKKILHRSFFSFRMNCSCGAERASHQLLLHPPPLVEVSAIPVDCAFFWPSCATRSMGPGQFVFRLPLAMQKGASRSYLKRRWQRTRRKSESTFINQKVILEML